MTAPPAAETPATAAPSGARGLFAAVTLAYAVAVAVVVLAPSNAGPQSVVNRTAAFALRHHVPASIALHLEPLCNVLVTVPLPVLVTMALGGRVRIPVLTWTGGAFVVFGAVEAAQALLLPQRTGSPTDVVTNTLGAFLGAVLVLVATRWASYRRSR